MPNLIEMSEAEIDALTAGPDIRELVAREVLGIKMGCKIFKNRTGYRLEWPSGESVHDNGTSYYGWGYNQNEETAEFYYPAVDSDIGAAWMVVNKLQEIGYWVSVNTTCDDGKYDAQVSNPGIEVASVFQTAPLAICKAALKAVRAMKLREVKK